MVGLSGVPSDYTVRTSTKQPTLLIKTLKLRLVSDESLLGSNKCFLGSYKGFLGADKSLEGRVLFTFKTLIIPEEFLDSSRGKGFRVAGATGLYVLSVTRGVVRYYIL